MLDTRVATTSPVQCLPKPAKARKMSGVQLELASERNDEADWDAFDSRWYRNHNYGIVRPEDRTMVKRVRDFFAASASADPLPVDARGLDVGAGSNLYPSFAMLPFCANLDLWEHSAANVRWLRSQQSWWHRFDKRWDKFWDILTENPSYRAYADDHRPMVEFSRKAVIRQGSIFDLPEGQWDMGTMFFVACSMSGSRDEFDRAVRCFLRSLRPKAPFAIAFMTGSTGYPAGRHVRFPAYPLTKDGDKDLQSFDELAYAVSVHPIDSGLRDGIGMLLITGKAQGGDAGALPVRTVVEGHEDPAQTAAS
jgi:hypothetical protein